VAKRAIDFMPLNLDEARAALRRLTKKPAHARVFKNYLMLWFFEPTTEPNVEYEIILRYDGKELTVARVQIVRIEPIAVTDVTKHRTQNPIVESVARRVRGALLLTHPRTDER